MKYSFYVIILVRKCDLNC